MKIQLELNYSNDRIFLNYWDSRHGNDVCALIKGNGQVDIDGEVVSIEEFFNRVKHIVETDLKD